MKAKQAFSNEQQLNTTVSAIKDPLESLSGRMKMISNKNSDIYSNKKQISSCQWWIGIYYKEA